MGIPCTKRSGCSDHALWRVRFHWWSLVRLWHLVGPPGTTSPFPLLTPQEAGSSISGMATLTALKQLPTVMRPSNRFPSSASSATASAGDGAAMIAHLQGREQALEPFGWDGTPGQMDRPGLSPQRRLHPGAVDAVSGLPHRKGAPRRPCTHRTGCGRRRERARYHRHQPRVPDLRAWDLYRPDSSESSS